MERTGKETPKDDAEADAEENREQVVLVGFGQEEIHANGVKRNTANEIVMEVDVEEKKAKRRRKPRENPKAKWKRRKGLSGGGRRRTQREKGRKELSKLGDEET